MMVTRLAGGVALRGGAGKVETSMMILQLGFVVGADGGGFVLGGTDHRRPVWAWPGLVVTSPAREPYVRQG